MLKKQVELPSIVPRGVTRLDGTWGKMQVGAPMFEPEVFWMQTYCVKKVLVTLLGLLSAPRVICSGNCTSLLPHHYAPACTPKSSI